MNDTAPLVRAQRMRPVFAAADYAADRLDLDLVSGTLTCVVGPDSSGKTRYLVTLAGIEPPARGTVSVLNHDVNTLDRDGWRRLRAAVGYVGADTVLLSNLTGLQNVLLPARYHDVAPVRALEERADRLLTALGVGDYRHELPAYMGEVQRARLVLARTLLLEPPVLFLDNPYRSLDVLAAAPLLDYLLEHKDRQGTALVLATDDLDRVQRDADAVLFVARGRIETFADLDALRASPHAEVRRYLAMRERH